MDSCRCRINLNSFNALHEPPYTDPHVRWYERTEGASPYDGHTLKDALDQVQRVAGCPDHAFVDMGYRRHGYSRAVEVHVDKRHRGRTAKNLWRWMKRRAAIEPGDRTPEASASNGPQPPQGGCGRPVQCHSERRRDELPQAAAVGSSFFAPFFSAFSSVKERRPSWPTP